MNLKTIQSKLFSGSQRTANIKKNIFGLFGLKGISILVSFLVVPMTLSYVDSTEYGIWMTISSIVIWLNYFDMGIANGFRNKFAEEIARENHEEAKSYVSTTYITLAAIIGIVYIPMSIINHYFFNWTSVLNLDPSYESSITTTVQYLLTFISITFVTKTFDNILTSMQKPALSSSLFVSGQVLGLLCVFILTHTTEGHLEYLALAFSGVPCILNILVTIYSFKFTYLKRYTPSFNTFNSKKIKSILGLGIQLFIISISMLVIFQLINIILTRYFGPVTVTQYDVCYKYFHIVAMLVVILVTPIWSAFTEAFTKGDHQWMMNAFKKLDYAKYILIPVIGCMVLLANLFFKLWVGDKVTIPLEMTLSIACMIYFMALGQMYMYMINGTSKFRVQLIIYVAFAIISIPIMVYFAKIQSIIGVCTVPILTYAVQALFCRIQILKLIKGTATGIWNK